MTGAVYADGPRGATLILSTADVTALDPYRHICDHSGYEQIQRATLHIESDPLSRTLRTSSNSIQDSLFLVWPIKKCKNGANF
jgi:hypothetical protein